MTPSADRNSTGLTPWGGEGHTSYFHREHSGAGGSGEAGRQTAGGSLGTVMQEAAPTPGWGWRSTRRGTLRTWGPGVWGPLVLGS